MQCIAMERPLCLPRINASEYCFFVSFRLIFKGMPDDVNIWKDSEIGIKYRQIEDKQQVSHASLNKLVFCFFGVFRLIINKRWNCSRRKAVCLM